METSNRRKFKVKTMDGNTTDFETNADIGVPQLKLEIEAKMNIPTHRQRLIFKSRLLKDDQKLSDYITKDDEVIHLMAMTEDQARSRSGTQRDAQANQSTQNNQAPPPNPFAGFGSGGAGDPFANMFGMFGNLMQGLNRPGATGQPQMSAQTIDLANILNPQSSASRAPASNSSAQSRTGAHRNPVEGTFIEQFSSGPARVIRITSRSGSRGRRANRNTASSNAEENKDQNVSTPQSTATQQTTSTRRASHRSVINLPHEYLHNANMSMNQMMGPGSMFPGPPLPPNGIPRTASVVLGSYLEHLQFTLSRLLPFIWRSGEILQREQHMVNSLDRADAQSMINQTGRVMEQCARALLLSAHYFRDFRIGEAPGEFRVENRPHPDFSQLVDDFNNSQNNEEGASGASRDLPRTTIRTTPSEVNQSANASEQSRTSRSGAQQQRADNPLDSVLQNLFNPQMMQNISGMISQLNMGQMGPRPQAQSTSSASQPASASNASQQRDVEMTSAEETKQTQSRHPVEEEKKERAQNRQQNLNNQFMNNVTNIASMGSENPISQAFQNLMPLLSGSLGAGGNPMTQTLGNMFPEENSRSDSFLFKVVTNCSLQDLIAIFNGNYEVVANLHPRTRDILLSDYMQGEDTEDRRREASERLADEINSDMQVPEEIKANVVQGHNPIIIAREVNERHIRKMVDVILDIEHNPEDGSIFLKRMTTISRWWIGDFIDSLKPSFINQIQDVLKFIRGNVDRRIRSVQDPSMQMMSGMFTDSIMQSITRSYNAYLNDRRREEEAEARELGISLDEYYRRRENVSREHTMEVDQNDLDEEPRIEEEPINPLQSNMSSAPATSHSTPHPYPNLSEAHATAHRVVEEEKDPEVKKLLEQMEEDQAMLAVDPPTVGVKSRAYRAIDAYDNRNCESGHSIVEEEKNHKGAKEVANDLMKEALSEYGFRKEDVERMMANGELDEEFVDHFRDVMRDDIRARRDQLDVEQGRFPELDKL